MVKVYHRIMKLYFVKSINAYKVKKIFRVQFSNSSILPYKIKECLNIHSDRVKLRKQVVLKKSGLSILFQYGWLLTFNFFCELVDVYSFKMICDIHFCSVSFGSKFVCQGVGCGGGKRFWRLRRYFPACDGLSRARLRRKENCVVKTQICPLWGLIPYWIGQVYGKVVSNRESFLEGYGIMFQ